MVDSDLGALAPAFRVRVEALLEWLTALGLRPRVHETHRSAERAQRLVEQGRSRARGGLSMHCYGVACDIICADHLWSCRSDGCLFFEALGEQARDLGLVWGGDWDGDGDTTDQTFDDRPHVQAVRIGQQALVRRSTPEQIAAFVARRLPPLDDVADEAQEVIA